MVHFTCSMSKYKKLDDEKLRHVDQLLVKSSIAVIAVADQLHNTAKSKEPLTHDVCGQLTSKLVDGLALAGQASLRVNKLRVSNQPFGYM